MNKGPTKTRAMFSFPQQQSIIVEQTPSLNTEKNELLSIMSKYLTKNVDRVDTVANLSKLEVRLSTLS
jgi:hypothetical protein